MHVVDQPHFAIQIGLLGGALVESPPCRRRVCRGQGPVSSKLARLRRNAFFFARALPGAGLASTARVPPRAGSTLTGSRGARRARSFGIGSLHIRRGLIARRRDIARAFIVLGESGSWKC
jgi:hypothetical protein